MIYSNVVYNVYTQYTDIIYFTIVIIYRVPFLIGCSVIGFGYWGFTLYKRTYNQKYTPLDISENNLNTVQSAASNMKSPHAPISGGGNASTLDKAYNAEQSQNQGVIKRIN